MRIGLDISQSVYEGTGSGRYVIELVKALLTLDKENEYVLFGGALQRRRDLTRIVERLSSASHRGVNSVKLPFPPRFFEIFWNSLHLLPVETFTGSLDIYHSSDWTQGPSWSKKITTVHDVMPFLFPEQFHERIIQAHRQRWKWLEKEVDRIIVDAEATKSDILNLFSIDSERIVVIPLACDSRFFDIGAVKLNSLNETSRGVSRDFYERLPEILKHYSIKNKRYILCVGTLEPRKNIFRLVDAFGRISKDLRDEIELVIVGKKSWVETIGSHKNVHFTGYVADEHLPYLYGGAQCFVMPSLYEGFGLPILEAMASGTPVICSHRSSMPEIGGDEVHYIEDAEDVESIRLVLEHVLNSEESELAQVAQNAYNRAKLFSWERTARETLEVYKSLVEKSN